MLLPQLFCFQLFASLPGGGWVPPVVHFKFYFKSRTLVPRIPRPGRGVGDSSLLNQPTVAPVLRVDTNHNSLPLALLELQTANGKRSTANRHPGTRITESPACPKCQGGVTRHFPIARA